MADKSKPGSGQQIAFFLVIVAALTAALDLYIIQELKTARSLAVIPLSWIPGLTAVACSKFFGNDLRDLALNKPGRVSLVMAYAIPAAVSIAALLMLILIGVGTWNWPASSALHTIIVQPVLGVFVSFLLAVGEELGWRGYLHTHMMRARIPEPLIATGLIWSVWHWPLILVSDYAPSNSPAISVALFTVTMTSFSVVLGWLRQYSRSVFPCALAHAVHTSWVQTICPNFYTAGRLSPYFSGEAGFVLAILYLALAIYLYRNRVEASNFG